jgi:hypothetical protein
MLSKGKKLPGGACKPLPARLAGTGFLVWQGAPAHKAAGYTCVSALRLVYLLRVIFLQISAQPEPPLQRLYIIVTYSSFYRTVCRRGND